MKPAPLKNKWVGCCGDRCMGGCGDYTKEDVAAAVEWLKNELCNALKDEDGILDTDIYYNACQKVSEAFADVVKDD